MLHKHSLYIANRKSEKFEIAKIFEHCIKKFWSRLQENYAEESIFTPFVGIKSIAKVSSAKQFGKISIRGLILFAYFDFLGHFWRENGRGHHACPYGSWTSLSGPFG